MAVVLVDRDFFILVFFYFLLGMEFVTILFVIAYECLLNSDYSIWAYRVMGLFALGIIGIAIYMVHRTTGYRDLVREKLEKKVRIERMARHMKQRKEFILAGNDPVGRSQPTRDVTRLGVSKALRAKAEARENAAKHSRERGVLSLAGFPVSAEVHPLMSVVEESVELQQLEPTAPDTIVLELDSLTVKREPESDAMVEYTNAAGNPKSEILH